MNNEKKLFIDTFRLERELKWHKMGVFVLLCSLLSSCQNIVIAYDDCGEK